MQMVCNKKSPAEAGLCYLISGGLFRAWINSRMKVFTALTPAHAADSSADFHAAPVMSALIVAVFLAVPHWKQQYFHIKTGEEKTHA